MHPQWRAHGDRPIVARASNTAPRTSAFSRDNLGKRILCACMHSEFASFSYQQLNPAMHTLERVIFQFQFQQSKPLRYSARICTQLYTRLSQKNKTRSSSRLIYARAHITPIRPQAACRPDPLARPARIAGRAWGASHSPPRWSSTSSIARTWSPRRWSRQR